MCFKRMCLLVIAVGIYVSIMVNHPTPGLKAFGYQEALNWYAEATARRVEINILRNPGLRELPGNHHVADIAAVIPGSSYDYPAMLDGFMDQGCQAIVECSALDAWHTTAAGQKYLKKMRNSAYRVVVFDGGHHLPTLGLAPDIIIIPITNGYAAHASSLDGMRAEVVAALAREAGCPAVVASVPRWGLVKASPSLKGITARIIAASPMSGGGTDFKPCASGQISSYGGLVFAYINREYIANPAALVKELDSLGVRGVHKVYLAFDYRYIDISSADKYCLDLSRHCLKPVLRVNEPVKVANAILSFGVGKSELPQPGYNTKNH